MTRALLIAALVGLGACADTPDDPAAGPRTVHPAPGLEADASARAMTATDPESVDAATGRLLAYIGAHAEGAEAADTLWSPSGVPEGADVSAEPFRRPGRRFRLGQHCSSFGGGWSRPPHTSPVRRTISLIIAMIIKICLVSKESKVIVNFNF